MRNKKRPTNRKLQIENLEERRLTAALPSQFGSFSSSPRTDFALVREISPIDQGTLTRGLVDGSSWVMGIRLNHNETFVRAGRRRTLKIESLEDRRLTAAVASHLSAFTTIRQSEVAIVRSVGPIEQVSLTRAIVDTSSWKAGLRPNHNETLVRLRRRATRKG
jgi:hypothetical protein